MVARTYQRVNPGTRWERSLERANAEGTLAYRLNTDRWMVSSTSNPTTDTHLVTTAPESCDCEGWYYRGYCKHVAAVRAEVEVVRTVQPEPGIRSIADLF